MRLKCKYRGYVSSKKEQYFKIQVRFEISAYITGSNFRRGKEHIEVYGRRLGMWIGRALETMMAGLVGPLLHYCISFYGDSKIIGRAILPPALRDPTPMNYEVFNHQEMIEKMRKICIKSFKSEVMHRRVI